MLFKETHLKGIRDGTIQLAFRNWKKPGVKEGSMVKTSIGLVSIDKVSIITEQDITDTDVAQAGFESRESLFKAVNEYPGGTLYKIRVSYYSEDPRIELRQKEELSQSDFEILKARLKRLESKYTWTLDVLQAIAAHPMLRAKDLAGLLGHEKEWLKLNIRKLKNLGLTVSHDIGYEISPLGKTYLEML